MEKTLEEILNEIIKSSDQGNLAPGNRFKRDDIEMKYGCSSHETGVAIAYFSLFFENGMQSL